MRPRGKERLRAGASSLSRRKPMKRTLTTVALATLFLLGSLAAAADCPGGFEEMSPLEAATRVADAVEALDVNDEFDYDTVRKQVLAVAESVDKDRDNEICF